MSYDLRIAVKVDGCDKFAQIVPGGIISRENITGAPR